MLVLDFSVTLEREEEEQESRIIGVRILFKWYGFNHIMMFGLNSHLLEFSLAGILICWNSPGWNYHVLELAATFL